MPPHVKNPHVHPLLSKQILDCVKIDPDDRPESMEFVGNRLELIADLLETPEAQRRGNSGKKPSKA